MKFIKLIVFFFIVTLIFCLFSPSHAESYVRIFHISGNVEVLFSSENGWIKTEVGMKLRTGDSIKTYRNSFAEIAFDTNKDTVVRINPNTYVVLKLEKNEKIELIDGEVFSIIKKLPRGSAFEIRTPTAVCGARGTGLGAKATKEKTDVSSYEDSSYAKGIDKDGNTMDEETNIPEGHKTVVEKYKKPSKLSKIADKNYDKWNKWKERLIDRVMSEGKKARLTGNLEKMLKKKEEMAERYDDERIKDRLSEKKEQSDQDQRPETKGD